MVRIAARAKHSTEKADRVRPIGIDMTEAEPVVQVAMVGAVIRHLNQAELVAGRIACRTQQCDQQRALVKVISAALQQGQLRALFGAEIENVANVVVDIIEYPFWVVLQAAS